MHPQIEQDHPGNCPICGMALEPKTPGSSGEEENGELRDMSRRFWIGAMLPGINELAGQPAAVDRPK
jgi:Cu+-exporting ATPase